MPQGAPQEGNKENSNEHQTRTGHTGHRSTVADLPRRMRQRYRPGRGKAGQPVVLVLRRGRRRPDPGLASRGQGLRKRDRRQDQLRTKVVHPNRAERQPIPELRRSARPHGIQPRQRLRRRALHHGPAHRPRRLCQAVRLGQEGDRRKRSSRQVRRERHHGRRYLVRYDQLR